MFDYRAYYRIVICQFPLYLKWTFNLNFYLAEDLLRVDCLVLKSKLIVEFQIDRVDHLHLVGEHTQVKRFNVFKVHFIELFLKSVLLNWLRVDRVALVGQRDALIRASNK